MDQLLSCMPLKSTIIASSRKKNVMELFVELTTQLIKQTTLQYILQSYE